jgi:hypothetical protein
LEWNIQLAHINWLAVFIQEKAQKKMYAASHVYG